MTLSQHTVPQKLFKETEKWRSKWCVVQKFHHSIIKKSSSYRLFSPKLAQFHLAPSEAVVRQFSENLWPSCQTNQTWNFQLSFFFIVCAIPPFALWRRKPTGFSLMPAIHDPRVCGDLSALRFSTRFWSWCRKPACQYKWHIIESDVDTDRCDTRKEYQSTFYCP